MPHNSDKQILGLCGSLRGESSNLRALQVASALTPAGSGFTLFNQLDDLPAFNPDSDPTGNVAVANWIDLTRRADAILVSSPVYARGYPGALKNALDWLVASDVFVAKPFALLNASTRSLEIQDTLITVLTTMSGVHVETATTALPLLGQTPTTAEILADAALAGQIEGSLTQLLEHCGTNA